MSFRLIHEISPRTSDLSTNFRVIHALQTYPQTSDLSMNPNYPRPSAFMSFRLIREHQTPPRTISSTSLSLAHDLQTLPRTLDLSMNFLSISEFQTSRKPSGLSPNFRLLQDPRNYPRNSILSKDSRLTHEPPRIPSAAADWKSRIGEAGEVKQGTEKQEKLNEEQRSRRS